MKDEEEDSESTEDAGAGLEGDSSDVSIMIGSSTGERNDDSLTEEQGHLEQRRSPSTSPVEQKGHTSKWQREQRCLVS